MTRRAENHVVIDGVENDVARLEWQGRLIDVPLAWLPKGVRDGDHLSVTAKDGTLSFRVDEATARRAQARNQAALNALNASDKGGDIDL